MWTIAKSSGRPLHPCLETPWNIPYTIAHVISLRIKYDSYLELPEPVPEEYWDYPHYVRSHIEKLYPHTKKTSLEIAPTEVEQ
jgi:hypothetical protein